MKPYLIFTAIALLIGSVHADPITVSIVPVSPSYILGEPITISLKIHNASSQVIHIELGNPFEDVFTFDCPVGADSGKIDLVKISHSASFGGMSLLYPILPNQDYESKDTLTRYMLIKKPGTYSLPIHIFLVNMWQSGSANYTVNKVLSFTVSPRDPDKLRAQLTQLAKDYRAENNNMRKLEIFKSVVSYTDPLAVEFAAPLYADFPANMQDEMINAASKNPSLGLPFLQSFAALTQHKAIRDQIEQTISRLHALTN